MHRLSVEDAELEFQLAKRSWDVAVQAWLLEGSRIWPGFMTVSASAQSLPTVDDVKKTWADFSADQVTQNIDQRAAWHQVLWHANRVFTKLEQGSKVGGSAPWYGTVKNQRRTDPLLQYVKQARHASEHGDTVLGHSVIVRDQPASAMPMFARDAATMTATTIGSVLDVPMLSLLPVTNRGVTYQPPVQHLGQSIQPLMPVVVPAMLAFLARLVAEAKARIS